MKLNKLTLLALGAALSMGFTACNDDDVEVVNYGDAITATGAGLQGATDVNPRTTDITVNFNADVEPANVSKIMVNDIVPDSVSATGSTLLIYMEDGLKASTDYTVTLYPYSVRGANEEEHRFLTETFSFSFTTGKAFSKDAVAKAPVNPNATAEAKKVYSFLLENYGTKTLTGAMGGVAWENGYADFIATKSGKYPAIVGFDFIHHIESEQGANWINYRDITPVKEAWENGSIPTISWHWRVPEEEDADPNNPVASFENVISDQEFDGSNWGAWLDLAIGDWVNSINEGEYLIFKVKDGATGAIGIRNEDWSNLNGVDFYDTTGNLAIECTSEFLDALKANTTVHISGNVVITGIVHADTPALEPKVTYRYDGNKFSPSAACFEGTPERAIIDADIAIIAQYLGLLQDAGIPVLWRPFHEAAGDYSWGAWFWWGKHGDETTKTLWNYLYDQLTNKYKLNNLIWVWTMQTSAAGQLANINLLRNAYPGDETVDIVGTDIYKDKTGEDVSAEYNLVANAIGQRKIVALSEVGNLPDFEAGLNNEACWSFFMNWYHSNEWEEWDFSDNNTRKGWRQAVNLPFMLNRGDFSVK